MEMETNVLHCTFLSLFIYILFFSHPPSLRLKIISIDVNPDGVALHFQENSGVQLEIKNLNFTVDLEYKYVYYKYCLLHYTCDASHTDSQAAPQSTI